MKYFYPAVFQPEKTLSIPAWLNNMALEKNINFSNVLQNALVHELRV